MTITVIVFFDTVINVVNEPVSPQAKKYPPTIFHNPNTRQLTGKNCKSSNFRCTTGRAIYHDTINKLRNGNNRQLHRRKADRHRLYQEIKLSCGNWINLWWTSPTYACRNTRKLNGTQKDHVRWKMLKINSDKENDLCFKN